MKLLLTLLLSSVLLCAVGRSAEPRIARMGEFERVVVKELPTFFPTAPISVPQSQNFIVVHFQGEFIHPGMHALPSGSTVASLFRPRQGGPGPLTCGIDRMSVLRKEGEEMVVYTARGSALAALPFPLVHGDRVVYRVTGF